MFGTSTGPKLLGFDVIIVGTILAGIAAFAVMMAIYAAVTVKDPMAKRVNSLNERREELKAGIITSNAKKRSSLFSKSQSTSRNQSSASNLR